MSLPRGTGVASYARMLGRAAALCGWRPELLAAGRARPRALRRLAAAWPGPAMAWRRAGVTEDGWAAGREGVDLFRTAQVHFDIWGRLRAVAGPGAPDVMHWSYPLPLRVVGRPNLYTVHDLIPLLHPGLTGIDAGRMRRMLARIVQRADHLVTVSEATRREVIATLGVAPERVTNTWQAVDVARAGACPEGFAQDGYWLHVGTVERRKNLGRLIAAWRASGTRHPLVLAGPDGFGAASILEGEGDVVRLPWVDRAGLLGLIRDARGLLMPSLAEGFGLPVAEAMALGTPVLTSRGGALEEVAGAAAVLVDPAEVGSIAAGLRDLDEDAGLRDRLRGLGVVQARLFTPEAYAARVGALYRRLVPGQAVGRT